MILHSLQIGLMLIAMVAVRATAADDSAELAKAKAQADQDVVNLWKGLPLLPAKPIKQIVLMEKIDKLLRVSSPAFSESAPQGVIQFTDLPGKAALQIYHTQAATRQSANLNLDYFDTSDPAVVQTHVQIVTSPGSIQVVHDIVFTDRTQTVTLMQKDVPEPPQKTIELDVVVMQENGPAPRQEAKYSADNLDALIYEHPVEVEKYLRPLLREIHEDDNVMGLNDYAAWQVLASLYKPSTELTAKVDALVAQFKSDEFAVRSQAAKDLKSIGGPAAAYLFSHSRQGLTDDQLARIDEFLHSFRLLTDYQAAADFHNADYLIDCLSSETPALRAMALQQLSTVVGHPVQFNINASADDRTAAIEKLRQMISPVMPSTRPG